MRKRKSTNGRKKEDCANWMAYKKKKRARFGKCQFLMHTPRRKSIQNLEDRAVCLRGKSNEEITLW